ncbi:MAG: Asp-tRNA(Asn)/Glu-tRNA(Gln) amidotransferase subunit GatC [Armatimonadetes bacterium]|nr:Asp-tRNA(Asn)/Glu-tRNA(Gln) amidotransferase subunit GatC [Armatimonadota bacterium]
MLDKAKIRHVAALAGLQLTDEEEERLTSEMNQILQYFRKLSELDTEEIPATFQVMPVSNVFREDEPCASLTLEETLSNAPHRQGEYFQMPRILES